MKNKILTLIVIFTVLGDLKSQMVFESFEDWNDTLNVWLPNNWELSPEIDTMLLNVERSDALNDGEYSVRIRSNVPFFEGNLKQHISKELPFLTNIVRMKMTYKCKGEGKCRVYLGQGTIGSNGINPRVIWQTEAGDSMTYSVTIDSFEINPPFEVFKNITLSALPIETGSAQIGICDFTVDSLLIEDLNHVVYLENIDNTEEVLLFPNPGNSLINIKTPNNIKSDVIIFNEFGNKLEEYLQVNKIEMNKYPSGMYFFQIKYSDRAIVKKLFLKN